MKDIENIEKHLSSDISLQALETKQKELQEIRSKKLMGSMMRAKAKWLHQGEKPSKFFCTLERKNFIDKTIRKNNLPNGQILTKQNEILNHVKQFYTDLFRSRDSIIPEINLDKVLENCNVTKLSQAEANSLGGPLTLEELGKVLLNMKNNKTPGMMASL